MSDDKNTLFIKMEEKAKLSFFFSYFFIIGFFLELIKDYAVCLSKIIM
jgi:hypothetical protein